MATSKKESFDVWLKKQEGYKNCIDIYKEQKIEIHLHELLYIKPDKFNTFFDNFSKARMGQIYDGSKRLQDLYNEINFDKPTQPELNKLYNLFSKFGYIDNSGKKNVHNLSCKNIISIYLKTNIELIKSTSTKKIITLETFIRLLYPSDAKKTQKTQKTQKRRKKVTSSYEEDLIAELKSGDDQIKLDVSSWYDSNSETESTLCRLVNFLILWEFIYYSLSYITDEIIVDDYNFIETENPFLMDVYSNQKKGKTVEKKKRARFIIKEDYLKKKISLQINFNNLKLHPLNGHYTNNVPPDIVNEHKSHYLISSYNVYQKDINIIARDDLMIGVFMNNSDIICYQEIKNTQDSVFSFNKKAEIKLRCELSKDLIRYQNKNIIKDFLHDNNIILIDKVTKTWNIPLTKYGDHQQFMRLTNRLSRYIELDNKLDNDEKKQEVSKLNVICLNNNICESWLLQKKSNTNVFIGKLGQGYMNNFMHAYIALKISVDTCIINIHLDTDDSNKIKQLELIALLHHHIPKYDFFKNLKRIYIMGDFNLDTHEITDLISQKLKNSYYKKRTFKLFFNNIITRNLQKWPYTGNSLDNCILIKAHNDRTEHDEHNNIYVTANNYSKVFERYNELEANEKIKVYEKYNEDLANLQKVMNNNKRARSNTDNILNFKKERDCNLKNKLDILKKEYTSENNNHKSLLKDKENFKKHLKEKLSDHSLIAFEIPKPAIYDDVANKPPTYDEKTTATSMNTQRGRISMNDSPHSINEEFNEIVKLKEIIFDLQKKLEIKDKMVVVGGKANSRNKHEINKFRFYS